MCVCVYVECDYVVNIWSYVNLFNRFSSTMMFLEIRVVDVFI